MKTCASSSWFVRKFKKPKQNSFKTISLRNFSDLILPIHQSPWRGSIWLSVCVCSSVIAHVIVVVLVVISACVRACAYSHPSKTSPTACMYVSREWSIRRRDVKEEPRYVRCVVIACRITWPGLLEKNNNKIIHRCGRLPGRQCFHVIIITNIHCIVMCVCVPRFVCVVVLWVYVEEACWRFACWATPANQPTTSLCMWRSLHIACCSVERFTWCVRSSSFLFLFLENFVTVDDVFGDMWSRLVYGTRRWLTSPMAWILIDYRNYFIGGSQEGWDGGEWEAWHARHTMSVSFIFVQAIFFYELRAKKHVTETAKKGEAFCSAVTAVIEHFSAVCTMYRRHIFISHRPTSRSLFRAACRCGHN